MFRLPFGARPRYSIVLTSEGLWLGSPDPGVPTVHAPLPAGALGPRSAAELSSFRLHDPEALRVAIQSCLHQIGRPVRQAHLALEGLLIRTVTLPIPFVPPREELELAIRAEAERYRVFAGAEVACDFAQLDSEEGSLGVLLAACRREDLEAVVEVFEGLGLTISSVEPAQFAMLRGLWAEDHERQVCQIVTVFPQQIHVSFWDRETLRSWRTLYVQASRLREGEAAALAETRLELQRSLMDLHEGICYLVDAPAPLLELLEMPEGVTAQALEAFTPEGECVMMRGATLYGTEASLFAFDLRLDRLKPARPQVSRGVGIPLAFAAVLVVALVANLWLSEQVKHHERAAATLQAEIAAMQAELMRPDHAGEAEAAMRAAVTRTESVAALFRRFQEVTPHDVWLSETVLGADSSLAVEGYALSREAPLALAKMLGQSRSLSGIEVPEVTETDWQGGRVYRFRIQAAFSPQGAFRP